MGLGKISQAHQKLLSYTQDRWLNQHKTTIANKEEEERNERDLQFARDLFLNWDVSGDGSISEEEAIKPLVSLGLVPDHHFARKVW